MKTLLLFCAIFFSSSAHSAEATRHYLFKKVSGLILAWEPFTAAWTKVKTGDTFMEQTLIEITQGASATIDMDDKSPYPGVAVKATEVIVQESAVFLLNRDILRKVKLHSFYGVTPPESNASVVKFAFEDAWDRLASFFSRFKVGTKGAGKAQDTSHVALVTNRLKLFTPRNGSLLTAERFPMRVNMIWQNVGENASYEVRVWRAEESTPTPVDITSEDHYSVTLPREGQYLVQVVTKDGQWQSAVVHVEAGLAYRKLTEAGGEPETGILLKLPPRDFVFAATGFPVSMTFQWEIPDASDVNSLFAVTDEKGQVLYQAQSKSGIAEYLFPTPGYYHWSVSNGRARSERVVRILPASEIGHGETELGAGLEKYLTQGASGVVYLSEGF